MAGIIFQSSDLKFDQLAFSFDLDDLVAGGARPGGDVGKHARVGGRRFQHAPDGKVLHCFADFNYRDGTEETFQVKRHYYFIFY
jgi:hypothetical protein